MTKNEQNAGELVACIRQSFRGANAKLEVFSSRYLTKKGDAIAATASPHMSDDELKTIAARAVKAGY